MTPQLKTTLQTLQSKLMKERKLYNYFKEEMQLWYPKQWHIIEQSFMAIATYLKTERVRAKHEAAQFMRGLEIVGGYGESDLVDQIHDKMKALKVAVGVDEREVAADRISEILELTRTLEGISYGDR